MATDEWRGAVYAAGAQAYLGQWQDLWWTTRQTFQGVVPPVSRTGPAAFDPAAWPEHCDLASYLRDAQARILQFQVHAGLCRAFDADVPVFQCSVLNNGSATGARIRALMNHGANVTWQEALAQVTGGDYRSLDATPLLEFFQPLHTWIKTELTTSHARVGWPAGVMPTPTAGNASASANANANASATGAPSAESRAALWSWSALAVVLIMVVSVAITCLLRTGGLLRAGGQVPGPTETQAASDQRIGYGVLAPIGCCMRLCLSCSSNADTTSYQPAVNAQLDDDWSDVVLPVRPSVFSIPDEEDNASL
jgi:hypothetical protein